MKSFTKAIEDVCDKRHARMIANGMGEAQAAIAIVNNLETLETRWNENPCVLQLIQNLKQAYSYEL